MANINHEIRIARKRLGLTLKSVCGEFMSVSNLSNIENGKTRIKRDTLIYLKKKLNLPDDLLENAEARGRVESLHLKASTYKTSKSMTKAISCYKEIIDLCEENFIEDELAIALRELGILQMEMNIQNAIKNLEKSAELFSEQQNYNELAVTTTKLGAAYFSVENYSKSTDLFKEALMYMKDDTGKGSLFYNLASTYFRLGEIGEATHYCELAIENLTLNDVDYLISANILQGILFSKVSLFHLSRKALTKAKKLSEKHNSPYLLSKVLLNLGNVEMELNQNSGLPMDYFKLSGELKRDFNDVIGMIRLNRSLAKWYIRNNNINLGESLLKEALQQSRKMKNKYDEMKCLEEISDFTLKNNKDYQNSIDLLFKALLIARDIQSTKAEKRILESLSNVFYLKGDKQKSFEKYIELKNIR
jgi:HTH-type transcriptional regulator, quorum sensing regulator NprR